MAGPWWSSTASPIRRRLPRSQAQSRGAISKESNDGGLDGENWLVAHDGARPDHRASLRLRDRVGGGRVSAQRAAAQPPSRPASPLDDSQLRAYLRGRDTAHLFAAQHGGGASVRFRLPDHLVAL